MSIKCGKVGVSERVPSYVSGSHPMSCPRPADPLRRGFFFTGQGFIGRGSMGQGSMGRLALVGLLWALGVVLGGIGAPLPLSAQTCPQPFTLRQESCPGGAATCTTKGSVLNYQELDRDILNTIGLCNGPGRYTWPVPAAGLLSSNASGVLSLVADDDTPDNDAEVPDAHTMSGGTITGTNLVTGILNLDTVTEGILRFPTSTTLPATCTLGDSYWDTDADTTGSLYICGPTSNSWKEVDDDGGSGGGNTFLTFDAPSGTDPIADSTTDTLGLIAGANITITGDATNDTITIASTAGGTTADPLLTPQIVEEFCSRRTEAGVYGSNNWSVYGTNAPGEVISESSHPCVLSLFTTTASGNVNSLGMGKFSTTDNFRVADHDRVWFVFKTEAAITSMEIRVGFMDDMNSTTGGDGFFLEYDDAVNGLFRCVTRQGGTTTTTNSAITVAVNTWYVGILERTSGGNHNCYVNSATSFATHTTNLPTNPLNLGFAVETKTTAARSIYLDYFRWLGRVLTSRY